MTKPLLLGQRHSRVTKSLDIADIFALKAKGRRERAALSFAEKLVLLDKLRDNVAPIRARRIHARVPSRPKPT